MPRWRCSPCSRSRIWRCTVTSSAVVGSSAISSLGAQAIAMAMATRWRMPPDISCGYCCARRSGSGMPTSFSNSTARRAAAFESSPRLRRSPSPIWRPIFITGLSEVIGSWNTMPISVPRTLRNSRGDRPRRSRPSNRTWPATPAPEPAPTRPISERTSTDLPDPDSPTMPSVCPACRSNETPSTARRGPRAVEKLTWALRTDKSGA